MYREVIFGSLFNQSHLVLYPRHSRQLFRTYDIQFVRSQVRDGVFICHCLRREEWEVLKPGLEGLGLCLLLPEHFTFVALSIPRPLAR